jgi:hypothetical protein
MIPTGLSGLVDPLPPGDSAALLEAITAIRSLHDASCARTSVGARSADTPMAFNGVVYQENAAHDWWEWVSSQHRTTATRASR